jgi:hypothetical protein
LGAVHKCLEYGQLRIDGFWEAVAAVVSVA